MRTDVGNAFVYGELKAVDTVTFDEIGGEYSYVKKVKEKYTRHTRTVTKTKKVNGETKRYTEKEVYWTWDEVDSWSKHSEKITFLDVEFDYGTIDFPYRSHIDTQDGGYHVRYVYYGSPTHSIGTVYTKLSNGTITGSAMHHNKTIEEALDSVMKDGSVVVFWIFWILLIGGVVYGFYYIDNRWLEDKKRYY
jgi:hypothetical protein